MSDEPSLLISTLRRGGATKSERVRVPGLTVLFHPDLDRVGECLRLVELLECRPALVSRTGGLFVAPGRRGGAPLADPHVSRKPLRFSAADRDGVRLEVERGMDVVADVSPVTGARDFTAAELDDGVVLDLSGRVFLLLHWLGLPALPAPRLGPLVGESAALERVRTEVARVAGLDVPVLLRGETGTGKELVARAIHAGSARSRGPFVAVNMAAIPVSTAASELFGHIAGAFTGAVEDAPGLFVQADRGTLLLDEVGEAPVEVQAALLRVLETGELQPVGGRVGRKVDVRVLAATDLDLEEAGARGTFREPLLHRLSGYVLELPPLRARRDDVGHLLVHFLREELVRTGELYRLEARARQDPWLGANVLGPLLRFDWPGNVRQLRNCVRQVVVASRGDAHARLPAALQRVLEERAPAGPPARSENRRPADITEEELVDALRQSGWRTSAAARVLGISRSTLYALIDASKTIRKAKALPVDELRQMYQACDGDLDLMSATLEVSRRGLQLRLKEAGLG